MFDHNVTGIATLPKNQDESYPDLCYYNRGSDPAGFRVYSGLFLVEMIGTFVLVSVILKIKEHTCQLRQMTSYETHQALRQQIQTINNQSSFSDS